MVVVIKVQENSGRKEYERKRGKRCYEQQQKKKKLFIFMLVITFQLADPCNMRMEDWGTAKTEGVICHHKSKSH